MRLSWTEQEESVLRTICENGGTVDDAVKILRDRSGNAILAKCKSLGVRLSGPTPEIDEAAFKAFLKGKK